MSRRGAEPRGSVRKGTEKRVKESRFEREGRWRTKGCDEGRPQSKGVKYKGEKTRGRREVAGVGERERAREREGEEFAISRRRRGEANGIRVVAVKLLLGPA